MPLSIEIITAERVLRREEDVDVLLVPGSEGQLAILPSHAPLMTSLDVGELVVRKRDGENAFAVGGGFMEVRDDHVVILADVAEAAEDIDVARAEEARSRAQERIRQSVGGGADIDAARARAALMRSLMRLRVAERARGRTGTGAR